ncbi:MAG: ribosomal RNA small subunit methyltransferase A [Thermococci archaeon]|nr:ribosomal RNA small subunit methyltransferase A [Thermococci archaeon]
MHGFYAQKPRPKKELDQHFLVDQRIANRIVERAELSEDDTVLEIGPGLGVLTERLVARAGLVYAVEKDERLARMLEERRIKNLRVVHGDALRVELPEFNKVVSNLPYSISSPITFRLIRHGFERAVLMYQLEFGRRLVATPGSREYSRLSVMVQAVARVEIAEKVSRNAFRPRPKVDSAVVIMEPRPKTERIELDGTLVKMLFQHRRKKAANAFMDSRHLLNLSKEEAGDVIRDMPHRDRRVFTLSPEEILEIQNHVMEILGDKLEGSPDRRVH